MANGNGHNGRYTAAEVAEAITKSHGLITSTAKLLGCSRTTVYTYINRHPTLQRALEDAREEMKDYAEAALFRLIKRGNVAANIFYLKTQAQDRGYIERYQQEISGPGGGPIQIRAEDMTDDQLAAIAGGGSAGASKA